MYGLTRTELAAALRQAASIVEANGFGFGYGQAQVIVALEITEGGRRDARVSIYPAEDLKEIGCAPVHHLP